MIEFFSSMEPDIVSSDRVLYTPSSFAKTSLLHLQEAGTLEAHRSHTSERCGLRSYLFFMVTSGSGKLMYDGADYKLVPGTCVFINCHKPYAHTTDPDHLWKLSWCHFYGPTLASVYDKYCERGGRPVFVTPEATGDKMRDALNDLMLISRSADYLRDMKINEKLSSLLTLIMAESWHPESRAKTQKRVSVIEVKKFLDSHYSDRITLDDLSKQFYIDKFYLTKAFKNQFGLPVSSYIQNVRVTKAKQLLRFTDKTVEEIGAETGMDNPAYFSRVFKNIEGVSPRKYREQW